MEIKRCNLIDISEKHPESSCKVYVLHVIINDIEDRASQMIQTISSTSWIERLGAIAQKTYKARAKSTIEKLVNEIFSKISSPITDEFGEYVVSMSAQDVLEESLHHTKVPLAELFKEQKSGNPGFDFHTESSSSIIAFGEAKYSASINPYTKALSQIVDFIGLCKDDMELTDLSNFVSGQAINRALNGVKAYIAAFSINSKNPETILTNVLKSEYLPTLLSYPELYLIGVEINDTRDCTEH